MIIASPEMAAYFKEIEQKIDEGYKIAIKARSLGLDPEFEPEILRAGDLAERVEKLVGPFGVAEVIRKLEKEMPREEAALKVAEMIVDGKFGKFEQQQAAEQAVRTSLAILTEGVVVAPLEGITEVKVKRNFDGTPYLALYFASPIRAAGGTAAALSILAADFVRRRMYLDPYKPIDEEVERFVEESELYRTVAAEQYVPSAYEIRLAARNIPVEITGERTEDVQVTSFRDLKRVEHNYVRGGAVLALTQGVIQKAQKIRKYVEKLNIDGWGWLSELVSKAPTAESETTQVFPRGDKYLDEVIAGRPVFSHPGRDGIGRYGGFRLRYGRSRTTGIAAIGIHPATMVVCEDFIATGTQLKTERPGKGGAVTPVDSIEGPIVKLQDGSVVQVNSVEEALAVRDQISEILFVGDILIGFGEFLENNHPLMPASYCEEWWAQDVEKALSGKKFGRDISVYLLPPYPKPSPLLAVEISEGLDVPLHPAYTHHYSDLEVEELRELAKWMASGRAEFENSVLKTLRLKIEPSPKRLLEEIGVPHRVEAGEVVVEDHALPLCRCLGIIDGEKLSDEKMQRVLQSTPSQEVIDIVQALAGFPVRKKAPTHIGARMGRPEKADPRVMSPPVHVLFPIGFSGGRMRNLVSAGGVRENQVEVAKLECKKCGTIGLSRKCQKCGGVADYVSSCPKCGQTVHANTCPVCKRRPEYYTKRSVDVGELLNSALKRLGENKPKLVKGVQGMTSKYKIPEPVEKGILRAKHEVFVFKDGTVRFDATNVPLTHFRPREIGTSVERLRELGYIHDINGDPLEDDGQLLELKVQDLVVSNKGAEYLVKASKFLDDLLQKFYGLPPFYNANSASDLVGQIVLGLAPHTSAATAGRIIGFTKASVGYAHPFFHAAKRRDCDGDEDCIMLLLDTLLNFSRRFLPSSRGGQMDAPFLLNVWINPTEIDKQAHNIDVMVRYPLEFYDATLRYENPATLKFMKTVEGRLGTEMQYEGIGFSFDTSDFSSGPSESRYKTLGEMEEKVQVQMKLAGKIRAVDERDVAELVIDHHFIRDLKGCLRTFATQSFRCVDCNTIHRRIPLRGVCTRCGGKLLRTVSKGTVEKYLQISINLANQYNTSDYTKQRLMLIGRDIKSTFESDAVKQMSLADFL
jgi:DNA polymerase II large subunit